MKIVYFWSFYISLDPRC